MQRCDTAADLGRSAASAAAATTDTRSSANEATASTRAAAPSAAPAISRRKAERPKSSGRGAEGAEGSTEREEADGDADRDQAPSGVLGPSGGVSAPLSADAAAAALLQPKPGAARGLPGEPPRDAAAAARLLRGVGGVEHSRWEPMRTGAPAGLHGGRLSDLWAEWRWWRRGREAGESAPHLGVGAGGHPRCGLAAAGAGLVENDGALRGRSRGVPGSEGWPPGDQACRGVPATEGDACRISGAGKLEPGQRTSNSEEQRA